MTTERDGTAPPFHFASAFFWSPEADAQKTAWQQLITGMKLAAGAMYPDCPLLWTEGKIAKAEHTAIALANFYADVRRDRRGNLVYIEADVVCTKRCDPFADDFFDIGIPDCKDKWAMMPLNPGVMFVRDTPGAQLFLDETRRYATHLPGNFPLWYAYQMALAYTYQMLKDEVRIKIFPNAEYNWSPDVYAPTDAYFVHLKGPRKAMQREYIVPIIEGKRGRLYVP